MKKLLAILLAFGVGAAFAQEAPQPQKGGKKGFDPAQNMVKRMDGIVKNLLAAYDVNKDGILDDAEKEAMEQDFANAEKQAMEIQKKAVLAMNYKRLKAIDVNGDLKLSEEEKAQAFQRLRDFNQANAKKAPEGGQWKELDRPRPRKDGDRPRPRKDGDRPRPRKDGDNPMPHPEDGNQN